MSESETPHDNDQGSSGSDAAAEGNVVNLEEAAAEKTGATDDGETLSEARARADENWDKFLRASAELDNAQRRAARDVLHARKFALEKFAAEIISVQDSLELGVQAANSQDASVESLREGSEMTQKLLSAALDRFGIKEINPEGEPFDPEFHEAMSMQESPDAEPNSVLKVIQKGYVLNERLLRPARVIVASEVKSEAG